MTEVLWAEDAESDQLLIQDALRSARSAPDVQFVEDGAQVLEQAARSRPGLVVLDVNMPRMDGFEALERLRRDPAMDDVPVVIFSTSDRAEDIARSKELGASGYVQKPLRLDAFTEAVHAILERARS